VEDGFADGGDGAGVVDVGAEIATVVDAAEHPPGARGDVEETEARAIGRGAVDGEAMVAARLELAPRRRGG
jgi:hypothetical protein